MESSGYIPSTCESFSGSQFLKFAGTSRMSYPISSVVPHMCKTQIWLALNRENLYWMCLLWGIILGPGKLMSPFPKYVFLMGKFSFKNTAVAKEGHLSIYLIFKHPFSMYRAYFPERLSLLFGIFSQRALLEVNLLDKPVSLCASSSLLNSQVYFLFFDKYLFL